MNDVLLIVTLAAVVLLFAGALFLIRRSPGNALVIKDGVLIGRQSYAQLLEEASKENKRLLERLEEQEKRHKKEIQDMREETIGKINTLISQMEVKDTEILMLKTEIAKIKQRSQNKDIDNQ